MSSDTNTSKLIINKLLKSQYEAIENPSETELYLTPDTTEQDIADAVSAHNTSSDAHSTLFNNKVTANSAITASTTKQLVTYDSKGLVTGGEALTSSDVTTALGYTPLANTVKYGANLSYSNSKLQLKDQDGNALGDEITISTGSSYTAGTGIDLTNNEISIVQDSGSSENIAKATKSLYGLVKPDGSSIAVNDGVISTILPSVGNGLELKSASGSFPTLSENGTMGGSTNASEAESNEGGYDAYKAFDGDSSTYWGPNSGDVPTYITYYTPTERLITKAVYTYRESSEVFSSGTIYGSNDNSTWTELASFSGNSDTTNTVDISTTDTYKYFKTTFTAHAGSGYGKVNITYYYKTSETYNVVVDNDTIKIDANNKLYADVDTAAITATAPIVISKSSDGTIITGATQTSDTITYTGNYLNYDSSSISTSDGNALSSYIAVPLKYNYLYKFGFYGDLTDHIGLCKFENEKLIPVAIIYNRQGWAGMMVNTSSMDDPTATSWTAVATYGDSASAGGNNPTSESSAQWASFSYSDGSYYWSASMPYYKGYYHFYNQFNSGNEYISTLLQATHVFYARPAGSADKTNFGYYVFGQIAKDASSDQLNAGFNGTNLIDWEGAPLGSNNVKLSYDNSTLTLNSDNKLAVTLTSGTDIKTINNNSIVGSGNLTIDPPDAGNALTLNASSSGSFPTLSENGTMGESTNAAESASNEGGYEAYRAFDGNDSTYWGPNSGDVPTYITYYTPTSLVLSQATYTYRESSEVFSSGTIYGSDDNSIWTELASFSNNTSTTHTVTVLSNTAYKYFKTIFTGHYGGGYGKVNIAYDYKINQSYDVNIDNSTIKINDSNQLYAISQAPTIDDTTITKNSSGQLQASSLVDLTATVTELNYSSGVTSNIQTQIDNKATDSTVVHLTGAETVSGNKTFNVTSALNSTLIVNNTLSGAASSVQFKSANNKLGSIGIDGTQLPIFANSSDAVTNLVRNTRNTATGSATNPVYINSSGVATATNLKYGADLSYSNSQLQLKDQDGNALGTAVTIESSPAIDNTTITTNTSSQLQTVGVINQNATTTAIKTWTGTSAEYDAIGNVYYNWTSTETLYQWTGSGAVTNVYVKHSGALVYKETLYDENGEELTGTYEVGGNSTTTTVSIYFPTQYFTYTYVGSVEAVKGSVYTKSVREPSTSTTIYDSSLAVSSLTVTSVATDSITLSDGNTYNYNESGNVGGSGYDNNTLYNITDDSDATLSLLETIYPVGSIYLTFNETCPLSALFGTWQLVGEDKVLQGAGSRGSVGSTLDESLPNIKGTAYSMFAASDQQNGAFTCASPSSPVYITTSSSGSIGNKILTLNASNSNSTYQDNAPVQPDCILVNIFKRTA